MILPALVQRQSVIVGRTLILVRGLKQSPSILSSLELHIRRRKDANPRKGIETPSSILDSTQPLPVPGRKDANPRKGIETVAH